MQRTISLFLASHTLALLLLSSLAIGQDAAAPIRAEITRLQQAAKDHPVTDPDFAPANAMLSDSLKTAEASLAAKRIYLALEQLGSSFDLAGGARASVEQPPVVSNSLPAFEEQWNKASVQLTALDQQARQRSWAHAPVALQALSEAAQGKSLPLLEGSRGFATSTRPHDGLFYLGEAAGEADFSRFAASLSLPLTGARPALRSLLPELERLQDQTNGAFQPPKSIDLHPRFIALNSTLKLARELNDRGFYAGALYQYLEAVRHYGMLDAVPLTATQKPALQDAIAAAASKLASSGRDESLPQLFLERAQSQVAHADGSAPSDDEWRSAQVIVQQVLPAYAAARQAPPPLPAADTRSIQITLVRWPYT